MSATPLRSASLRLLSLFFAICLFQVASAAVSGEYSYTVINGEVTITSFGSSNGTQGAVVVPETLGGLPVTAIGAKAFYYLYRVTSITLPESVTSIGEGAFQNCSQATSINLPAGLTTLGKNTFSGCSALVTATVPGGVGKIPSGAFNLCAGLQSVVVSPGITEIGDTAFGQCSTLTHVSLPEGITRIAPHAFRLCPALESLAIPTTVTELGGFAFWGCSRIRIPLLPANLASIGSSAFLSCTALETFQIPASVTTLGDGVVADCRSLAAVSIDPANPAFAVKDGILFNKTFTELVAYPAGNHLSSYLVPVTVSSIRPSTFRGCPSLTALTIVGPVQAIGNDTCNSCPELRVVSLPAGLLSIGESAFAYSPKLRDIALPSTLTAIGSGAFRNCSALHEVAVPGGVKNIGWGAFENCASLQSISFAEGVASIGAGTLTNCGSLTSLAIPASMEGFYSEVIAGTSIASISVASGSPYLSAQGGVLYNAAGTQLITIPPKFQGPHVIPEGVTEVVMKAGKDCTGLTALSFPASIRNFGYYGFAGCTGLQGVDFAAGPTAIASYAFQGCSSLKSVSIPAGVTVIGESAFSKCSAMNSLRLPASLTEIGNSAFSNCTSLPGVTLPAALTKLGYGVFFYCGNMTRAVFLGNAIPVTGDLSFFRYMAPGFTIYYVNGRTGFTTPSFQGFPCVNLGEANGLPVWTASYGLPANVNLDSDPNGDGVSLFTAYALNLAPQRNTLASVPRPQITDDELRLSYYAGRSDVNYIIEASSDLKQWTSSGVIIGNPDAQQIRTARIARTGRATFLRIRTERK